MNKIEAETLRKLDNGPDELGGRPAPLLFALDFDGTYSEDPELWQAFISLARARGHRVMCVTQRYEHEREQIERQLTGKVDRIVYTGRKAKARHMQFLGHTPDVWIDDLPHWILFDAAP